MQDLTLQVAGIHFIHIYNADSAYAGSSQIQRSWATKTTSTEQQHFACKQFCLTFNTNFWQQNMSLIAIALLSSQRRRCAPLTTFVFPLTKSTCHRNNICVAKFLQCLCSKCTTNTTSAIDHDRRVFIGDLALDLCFKMSTWNMNRQRQCSLLEFVGFAHVKGQG